MKKTIALTLAALMLILSLSSCVPDAEPSTDDTTNQDQSTDDAPQNKEEKGEVLSNDSKLIIELMACCDRLLSDIDPAPITTENKIDIIKRGYWPFSEPGTNYVRPLLVDYSESTPYYVCAYYDFEHDVEYAFYCCSSDYTWVKFENAEDIPEYYNDEKFLISFQVNRASYVKGLLSDDSDIKHVEHYQVHTIFHGVVMPDDFERTFVLLVEPSETEICHSTETYNHRIRSFSCICLDGEYYYRVYLYSSENPEETIPENTIENLKYDFGKYFDSIMDLMIFDKYQVALPYGCTEFFGLIDVDEFADKILKGEE